MKLHCAIMLHHFFKCYHRRMRLPIFIKSKAFLCVVSFLIGYIFNSMTYQKNNHVDSSPSNVSGSMQLYNEPDVLLVIIIFSSVNNFNKRQTIRETWLLDTMKSKEVKHFFVISEGNSKDDQKILISIEEDKHNDLLLLSNLEDTFFLLTLKLVATFGWLTNIKVLGNKGVSKTVKSFKNFKFVLKCDDDSFVRVTEVINELKSVYSNDKGNNLYWGFFDGRSRAKKSGKYKEDEWKICDHYIPYALGGGYVLAQPLVEFIAKNEYFLKKYNNEDISVGAWLGNYEGINRVHDPRFDTEYLSRGCHQTYLITHKQSETSMRTLHDNLKNTGHLCRREYKTRMSYIYNWQVLPSNCCARVNPNVP